MFILKSKYNELFSEKEGITEIAVAYLKNGEWHTNVGGLSSRSRVVGLLEMLKHEILSYINLGL